MTPFLIIVPIVLILAFIVNYLTKEKDSNNKASLFIEPLQKDFKPILSEIEFDELDYQFENPPPLPIEKHFPPNPSQANIESYYQSMSEKEQPENLEAIKQIHTVNMYVESHYELNLSMLGKGPTIEMIHQAYEKLLNEHVNAIAKGKTPRFDMNVKKRAKDYLIAHYTKEG